MASKQRVWSTRERTNWFKYKEDTVNGYYGFQIRCAPDFDANRDFDNQPSTSPGPFFNLWDNPMTFWVYANTRRVIIVAKVNTSYVSMYAGMFLPFSTPEEYPFPLYIGGNYGLFAEYDRQNSGNRMIASPGNQSAFCRKRDNPNWKEVSNFDYSVSEKNRIIDSSQCVSLWPGSTAEGWHGSNAWTGVNFLNFKPTLTGEFPAFPAHLFDRGTGELIGALDGVFNTPGFDRVSEQEVFFGNLRYRIFQDIFRTSANNYMAIQEI